MDISVMFTNTILRLPRVSKHVITNLKNLIKRKKHLIHLGHTLSYACPT